MLTLTTPGDTTVSPGGDLRPAVRMLANGTLRKPSNAFSISDPQGGSRTSAGTRGGHDKVNAHLHIKWRIQRSLKARKERHFRKYMADYPFRY